MGKSLFITGASGFVGSRLLQQTEPGMFEKIYCLVRRPDALPADLAERDDIEPVVGDLLAASNYAAKLSGCDTVIHLAAVTGKAAPAEYFRVNEQGTRVLVEAAKSAGVTELLHVSTIAARFPDQTRYFYAQSKQRAEQVVADSGIAYTILRPTIIIGPEAPVLTGLSKMAGAPVMPVFGDGKTMVQPVSVDDLIACIQEIVASNRFDGETIEIGGPDKLSIEEFLTRIRRIQFGKSPRTLHVPFAPTRAMLSLLERVLLPVMPLTAGQLASFINDGTANSSEFLEERTGRMQSVDAVLESVGRDE